MYKFICNYDCVEDILAMKFKITCTSISKNHILFQFLNAK